MSENLKETFDSIQGIFNRCINHVYITLVNSLSTKFSYLGVEQSEEIEKQEYLRTSDELMQLYMRNAVLAEISNYFSSSDFFWESGFYELMKPNEKKKYLLFSITSFDYSQYEQDNVAYYEDLPYFYAIVKAVVWERYLAHLRKKKEEEPQKVIEQPQEEINVEQAPVSLKIR